MISAGASPPPTRGGRWWRAADAAGGGLVLDLILYAVGAAFAALTAATSTLPPHRAWGSVAAIGYAVAAGVVVVQLAVRRRAASAIFVGTVARAILAALTWASTALLPLVIQAAQRAGGRTDRAQEEVVVVERGGERLLEHGSPYLAEDRIAALPAAEWLLGYLPYQPGMALFGLPRALAGAAWWTDARVWFAVATATALGIALACLPRGPGPVRAAQVATVLPVCALTLATGGDDLPVLALCLLALALAAQGRFGAAGIAAGLAGALKLFAWPVILVLLVHAATRGRRAVGHFAAGALGVPILALVPPALVDAGAVVDNVLRFPLGQGLVSSPARSPFPGYLIASTLPAGRAIAAGLLVAAGVAIAVGLGRRPPRTASAAALVCAYGLLAAILLMPSTRFGYLLYPAAFAVWAAALWQVEPADSGDSVPQAPRAAYT